MTTVKLTTDAEILSILMEFPGDYYYETLKKCNTQINESQDPETEYCFADFVGWIAINGIDELRTVYIERFRLSRAMSLLASDFVIDCDWLTQRDFVEQLEHVFSKYKFRKSTQRSSNFIPEIIWFAPLLENCDHREIFLQNIALYQILRILDYIEQLNPYRSLLSFVGNILAQDLGQSKTPIHFEQPVNSMFSEVA